MYNTCRKYIYQAIQIAVRGEAKTKVKVICSLQGETVQPIPVCGEDIIVLENFTRLGSTVHNNSGSNQEVFWQTGLACSGMDSLNKHMILPVAIQDKELFVFPTSPCANKTLTINSDLNRQVDASGNKCQHRIMGYRWNEFASN